MEEQINALKNLLLSEDPTNIDLAIEIMKGLEIDFISFVDEHSLLICMDFSKPTFYLKLYYVWQSQEKFMATLENNCK